jgi:HAE1 family hydrophobic/amphiphilic exporter-1
VDFPTIQVSAGLPGASPEMMAASVATPLEKQFSTISGVDSMTSSSSLGFTNVTLQFSLDRDLDAAAQDVQIAIATAQRLLPPGMPTPPTFRKVNPADQPIIILSMNSQTLPLSKLDDYAENMVAQRISMLSGVALVNVWGSTKYAVRVQMDPNALAARNIALTDVETAIDQHNVNLPSGTLWGARQAFTVQATGQLTNAEQYGNLVVTSTAYRTINPGLGITTENRRRARFFLVSRSSRAQTRCRWWTPSGI